ncbi:MAG: bifunctional riboflavin kinase/FAD synthetase [Thermodesulfovibrionales bacterium]
MILITELSQLKQPLPGSVVTLGNFDGIHLGHQELIRMIIRRAQETGALSVVVTFRPHPLKILAPEKCPPLISIYEEKIRLIEQLGVDVLVKIPFSREFSSMSSRDFAQKILHDLLQAREIFVGYNYRFGRGREGTVQTLRHYGEEFGFLVNEVGQISLNGEEVSSSRVRALLAAGDVEHAGRLLGRPYAITGVVVKGDGRGKTIGHPTANIAAKHEIIPANGVYAVKVLVRERLYDGVVNIGVRPTFETGRRTIEAFIFDFNEDVYGEEMTVSFYGKIREEVKFADASQLRERIGQDIREARTILSLPFQL